MSLDVIVYGYVIESDTSLHVLIFSGFNVDCKRKFKSIVFLKVFGSHHYCLVLLRYGCDYNDLSHT